jgi:hypothetical protein
MIRGMLVVVAAVVCAGLIVGITPPPSPATAAPALQVPALPTSSIDSGTHTAICTQAWPYYAPSCLRDSRQPNGMARVVRIVTADRLACGSNCAAWLTLGGNR